MQEARCPERARRLNSRGKTGRNPARSSWMDMKTSRKSGVASTRANSWRRRWRRAGALSPGPHRTCRGQARCFRIARPLPPPSHTPAPRLLPPHLPQANTSKSKVLLSSSAQFTHGVLSSSAHSWPRPRALPSPPPLLLGGATPCRRRPPARATGRTVHHRVSAPDPTSHRPGPWPPAAHPDVHPRSAGRRTGRWEHHACEAPQALLRTCQGAFTTRPSASCKWAPRPGLSWPSQT